LIDKTCSWDSRRGGRHPTIVLPDSWRSDGRSRIRRRSVLWTLSARNTLTQTREHLLSYTVQINSLKIWEGL